jgi:hypothetical protein
MNSRFEAAFQRFDDENARDPNLLQIDGQSVPRELAYSQWLTHCVLKLRPDASEALRLAARSQHLCRWMIPRDGYPMTRTGYLQWREALKKFHAQKSGAILRECGYESDLISRVQSLNLKQDLATDPETQALEDALCLVFLEHQFAELANRTPEDKMIHVLQKTWSKMSPTARAISQFLVLGEREKALLAKALAQAETKGAKNISNPQSRKSEP